MHSIGRNDGIHEPNYAKGKYILKTTHFNVQCCNLFVDASDVCLIGKDGTGWHGQLVIHNRVARIFWDSNSKNACKKSRIAKKSRIMQIVEKRTRSGTKPKNWLDWDFYHLPNCLSGLPLLANTTYLTKVLKLHFLSPCRYTLLAVTTNRHA